MAIGYALYFCERLKNRVIRWAPDSGDVTVVAGESGGGDRHQLLDDPYGLAFDTSGKLLIADKRNHRIVRVDSGQVTAVQMRDTDGHRRKDDASPGWFDPTVFTCPGSLWREAGGTILCALFADNTIYRLHPSGRMELVLGRTKNRYYNYERPTYSTPPQPGRDVVLASPTSAVSKSDGTLYFIERHTNVIRRFHPSTGMISVFPLEASVRQSRYQPVPEQGDLAGYSVGYAASIALDLDERVYVCDALRGCVLRLDEGAKEYTRVTPMGEDSAGRPSAACFAADGTVWLADSGQQCIQSYLVLPDGRWRRHSYRLTGVGGHPLALAGGGMGLVAGS